MEVIWPKSGKYVVAVSGGVDSMVLLDSLHNRGDYELIVVHLDHGIRDDSYKDKDLVDETAQKLSLEFINEEIKLGARASEAKARQARYKFLNQVKSQTGAVAVITAHHQDDVLETAIHNILRGTGRKGLSSLRSRQEVVRPLLKVTKDEILNYARTNNIVWREDSTNQDTAYTRNYIRHKIISRLSSADRVKLVNLLTTMTGLNDTMDKLLSGLVGKGNLDRAFFNSLPHDAAKEVMAHWLRQNNISGFDKKIIERLTVACKTRRAGKVFPVMAGYNIRVTKEDLALTRDEC
jgi:tRNA(Ile)-lysidine synthetase-like protein